ncbi:MAG TPA: rhomboid family intramembrane serine protease [Bacillus sp. (in: firmicutes)]|uniref:rhomboid family intramembrane serine protease n=1 Tax=Bacillus litorisediminis TaxID=2922713 RepID=UPI001FAE9E2D|nr:rhomboid family intramembrane serine protease [Bacillus litorisediminis]HWO77636.1 rhomboid family intramembrane serine protease [Bacillus sp. (in: firmicutes)]
MSFRESYLLWKLAYELISSGRYQLIYESHNGKELWLEKVEGHEEADLIHLNQYDLDWSNWLRQHTDLSIDQVLDIKQSLYKKNLSVLNVYITPYPPVDDGFAPLSEWYHPTDSPALSWYTLILDQADQDKTLNIISQISGCKWKQPFLITPDEHDVLQLREYTKQWATHQRQTIEKTFQNGKPIFTYLFIAIQLAVFAFMELEGSSEDPRTLLEFGAKFNPLILAGEWYRLITPIFIHIGVLHLLMNTMALYYLGTLVERIFGSVRFFFIYMIAGIIGSIASFAFSPNLSAGASGAIFGCFGALLYFGMFQPKLFLRTLGYNIFIVIALNLALGFAIPGIDNAGHIGGLVGGFTATGIVHFPKKFRFFTQIIFLFLTFGIGAGLLYSGAQIGVQAEEGTYLAQMAQGYVEEENFEKAYKLLNSYDFDNGEPSADIYFMMSYIEIQWQQYELAATHLKKVIEIDPKYHQAYYNLALLYYHDGKIEEAYEFATQARDIKPNDEQYRSLVDELTQFVGGEL